MRFLRSTMGLLTAVVSLYYYANVIKAMYFSPDNPGFKLKAPTATQIVLVLGVVGIIVFGIYPDPILKFAMDSAGLFALP